MEYVQRKIQMLYSFFFKIHIYQGKMPHSTHVMFLFQVGEVITGGQRTPTSVKSSLDSGREQVNHRYHVPDCPCLYDFVLLIITQWLERSFQKNCKHLMFGNAWTMHFHVCFNSLDSSFIMFFMFQTPTCIFACLSCL